MTNEQVSITAKLLAIQCKLKAPKGRKNEFGSFKFNYRNASDIIEAVKPLNEEQGLLLTLSDDIVHLGDRFYVKATATVTDGEHSVEATAFARETEVNEKSNVSQLTGSASSYARKYALCGLYAIDDSKDIDAQNNAGNYEYEKRVSKAITEIKSVTNRTQLAVTYNKYADIKTDKRIEAVVEEMCKKYPDESKRKASAAHS